MTSRRHRNIPLGGRYKQVSLYYHFFTPLQEVVYQWARFRFGVFDERPQGNEPLLYPVNFGEDFEGSRCSLQIPGTTNS